MTRMAAPRLMEPEPAPLVTTTRREDDDGAHVEWSEEEVALLLAGVNRHACPGHEHLRRWMLIRNEFLLGLRTNYQIRDKRAGMLTPSRGRPIAYWNAQSGSFELCGTPAVTTMADEDGVPVVIAPPEVNVQQLARIWGMEEVTLRVILRAILMLGNRSLTSGELTALLRDLLPAANISEADSSRFLGLLERAGAILRPSADSVCVVAPRIESLLRRHNHN